MRASVLTWAVFHSLETEREVLGLKRGERFGDENPNVGFCVSAQSGIFKDDRYSV